MGKRYRQEYIKDKKDALRSMGKSVRPTRFVLLASDSDEYLSVFQPPSIQWEKDPDEAIMFVTFKAAEDVALELITILASTVRSSFTISICELYETELEYGIRKVAYVKAQTSATSN